jgi:ABC-type amino acid transport substrate-binding protein
MQHAVGKMLKYSILIFAMLIPEAQAEPARFFYSELPPYEQTAANGGAEGLGIDAVKAILTEAGFIPSFELFSVQRGLAALQKNIDLTTIVSPTLAQQSEFLFSKLPVYYIKLGVVRLKSTSKLADLVTLQQHHYVSLNDTFFPYLHEYLPSSSAFFANQYNVATLDDALRLISHGRYDYFLSYYLTEQELQSPFLVFDPLSTLPVYLAMSKTHPDAEKMLQRVDAALTKHE